MAKKMNKNKKQFTVHSFSLIELLIVIGILGSLLTLVLPGFNDTSENIASLIQFMKKNGKNEINILPLHHLGKEKYQKLNKEYIGEDIPVPTNENLRAIEQTFQAAGIHCYMGSETPF